MPECKRCDVKDERLYHILKYTYDVFLCYHCLSDVIDQDEGDIMISINTLNRYLEEN